MRVFPAGCQGLSSGYLLTPRGCSEEWGCLPNATRNMHFVEPEPLRWGEHKLDILEYLDTWIQV